MNHQPQDHFSRVAGDYARFRPSYPVELYRWLASITRGHEFAWDAGTGNGQAAMALAAYFARVLATDFSPSQIARAIPHPNVEYRVAPAEESGAPDGSVDLVTVAQALHWFDIPAFFIEARRVLRPGGALAAWTYGVIRADEDQADRLLHQFYYDEIGPWWPANRKIVEDGYQSVDFPFTRIDAPAFDMAVQWNLAELTGYIGTWSSVSRYRDAKADDPVPRLAQRLAETWGNPLSRRQIRWPLSILAGTT